MSRKAIILELRPKWLQLSKEKRYSEEDVVDILCEFARGMYPDVDPQELRGIIIESFVRGRNEI
jgi:hypothetical protein